MLEFPLNVALLHGSASRAPKSTGLRPEILGLVPALSLDRCLKLDKYFFFQVSVISLKKIRANNILPASRHC